MLYVHPQVALDASNGQNNSAISRENGVTIADLVFQRHLYGWMAEGVAAEPRVTRVPKGRLAYHRAD